MSFRMKPVLAVVLAAVLLGGCEDPLEPGPDRALLETQGSPRTPNNLEAGTISPTQINLLWSDNSSNETGWEIHRSTAGREGAFSLLAQTAANVTTHSDVGLEPTTEYCYRIRSFRTSGRKITHAPFSNTECETTLGPPEAPSSLTAVPEGSDIVMVSWVDNSSKEEGYRVESGPTEEGAWATLSTLPANTTSLRHYVGTVEKQACYRVVAFSVDGDSRPSVVDCTTAPAAPTALAATSPAAGRIELTWTDNSAVEDGYQVYRRTDGTASTVVAILPANSTSYSDVGTKVDTTYWYMVSASKDGGHSYYSNTVSVAAASAPPNAPSSAKAYLEWSWIIVEWSDESLNEDGFRVEQSLDGGTTWETVLTTSAGSTRISMDAPVRELDVCFRVFAFNSNGASGPSNTDCAARPDNPTNLVATAIDHQSIELVWDDNSLIEDNYVLERYDPEQDGYWSVYLPPNTTSYRETGLASGTWYEYSVIAAKDALGFSDYSNPAGAMTDLAPATLQNSNTPALQAGVSTMTAGIFRKGKTLLMGRAHGQPKNQRRDR